MAALSQAQVGLPRRMPPLCGDGPSAGLSGPGYIQRVGCNMSRAAIKKKIKEISMSAKMSHLGDLKLDKATC